MIHILCNLFNVILESFQKIGWTAQLFLYLKKDDKTMEIIIEVLLLWVTYQNCLQQF